MKPMFKKLTIMVLAAGLIFGPLPAGAVNIFDSTLVPIAEAGNELETASLDKEKPSKEEKPEKEEKESKSKKKYDDFKDKDKNGIDDRFEKPTRPGKETPKKRKIGEPGEEVQRLETGD